MNTDWRFASLKTGSGNVLKDFLSKDAQLQARVDSFLRRLRVLPVPWPPTYCDTRMGGGVVELRVDFRKVEYRFYGAFAPGSHQFTVILAGSGKKRQQKMINAAKQLKTTLDLNRTWIVEDYDV
jgi:putative component of toxin-antitoxin plasmid stabilization module